MYNQIEVRRMTSKDIDTVYRVFAENNIGKSLEYISECWKQNETGERITLLAFYKEQFAGSLHLLFKSYYPFFLENGIPEVNDFNVIPILREKGIGSALMDAIEEIALKDFGIVGIGVGLYDSYGSAQRIYAKRGYIPDGRGVMYKEQPVSPGSQVLVDDDLNLYFTKQKQSEG
ncbi:GNAT family N-acetyltransferase [Ornithinibacillus sp. JPR2-1]|uniref:GNAT family N-acetyltransferase n=1 Tax=Ornithinibacillus sp. JPR2-1 TaxID=2094019 RepID=UPI0031DB11CB